MKSKGQRLLALVLFVVLIAFIIRGCVGQPPDFRPSESPDGGTANRGAAYYPLEVEDRSVGEAKVSFLGFFPARDPTGPVVELGLRVRNDGTEPIRVDVTGAELEIQSVDGKRAYEKVIAFGGPTSADPKTTSRLQLSFGIPKTIGVEDIVSLELAWAVETLETRISKSTPFYRKRFQERHAYFYLDPFWGSRHEEVLPGWLNPPWPMQYQ